MTLENIQRKSHELNAKTRRALLGGLAVSILIAGICAYGITSGSAPALRATFAVALLWTLAGQYCLQRGIRSPGPDESAPMTGLKSYRHEVERQRTLSGRVLMWSLGPVLLALAGLIALILGFGMEHRGLPARGALRNMAPFLTLLFLWLVGVIIQRLRGRRELRREIENLNATERENLQRP